MSVAERVNDPIAVLLDDLDDVSLDDYVMHLCTISDVVKNDLRKVLGRENEFIHDILTKLVGGALDENSRYKYSSSGPDQSRKNTLTEDYVRVQCLISEWLCIYRSVKVYMERYASSVVERKALERSPTVVDVPDDGMSVAYLD